jgi:signal transduction histidine kinase
MANAVVRKPVGNFFIKKSLQLGLIVKILTASIVSSLVAAGTLFLVYYQMYRSTAVYMFDHGTNALSHESIAHLIVPTLGISTAVSLLLAFGIGLYASRKYAVPVFKIEQWASQLLSGKLTATLRFREREEMKELSNRCNELGTMFRETMLEIQKDVKALQAAGVKEPAVGRMAEMVGKMELTDKQ